MCYFFISIYYIMEEKEQYLLNRAIEISNNLKPSTVYNREYYLKNKILYARNQVKYVARKQYFDYESDFDRLGVNYNGHIPVSRDRRIPYNFTA